MKQANERKKLQETPEDTLVNSVSKNEIKNPTSPSKKYDKTPKTNDSDIDLSKKEKDEKSMEKNKEKNKNLSASNYIDLTKSDSESSSPEKMEDYCSSKQKDEENIGASCSKINKELNSLRFSASGVSRKARPKRQIKLIDRYDPNATRALYDNKGVFIATNQDLCDCLNKDCPGCHFPCPQCKSCKCGSKCRVNRCWYYESVETEGLDIEYEFDPE